MGYCCFSYLRLKIFLFKLRAVVMGEMQNIESKCSQCAHSAVAHVFRPFSCGHFSTIKKVGAVFFHIFTLGIPLLVYHISRAVYLCFFKKANNHPSPAIPQNIPQNIRSDSPQNIDPSAVPRPIEDGVQNPSSRDLGVKDEEQKKKEEPAVPSVLPLPKPVIPQGLSPEEFKKLNFEKMEQQEFRNLFLRQGQQSTYTPEGKVLFALLTGQQVRENQHKLTIIDFLLLVTDEQFKELDFKELFWTQDNKLQNMLFSASSGKPNLFAKNFFKRLSPDQVRDVVNIGGESWLTQLGTEEQKKAFFDKQMEKNASDQPLQPAVPIESGLKKLSDEEFLAQDFDRMTPKEFTNQFKDSNDTYRDDEKNRLFKLLTFDRVQANFHKLPSPAIREMLSQGLISEDSLKKLDFTNLVGFRFRAIFLDPISANEYDNEGKRLFALLSPEQVQLNLSKLHPEDIRELVTDEQLKELDLSETPLYDLLDIFDKKNYRRKHHFALLKGEEQLKKLVHILGKEKFLELASPAQVEWHNSVFPSPQNTAPSTNSNNNVYTLKQLERLPVNELNFKDPYWREGDKLKKILFNIKLGLNPRRGAKDFFKRLSPEQVIDVARIGGTSFMGTWVDILGTKEQQEAYSQAIKQDEAKEAIQD